MAKRTAYIPPADRAAAGPAVTETLQCEVGNHARCAGRILSLTASSGADCLCECHDGHDLLVEASLEDRHFGRLFAYDL